MNRLSRRVLLKIFRVTTSSRTFYGSTILKGGPVMSVILSAVPYKQLAEIRNVYNKDDIINQGAVSIELPDQIASDGKYILKDMLQTVPESPAIPIALPVSPQRVLTKWIDVNPGHLDMTPGTHIYGITLVHTTCTEICRLYFTYIIQDDNPEKPYIYMKREEES